MSLAEVADTRHAEVRVCYAAKNSVVPLRNAAAGTTENGTGTGTGPVPVSALEPVPVPVLESSVSRAQATE